MTTRVRQAAKLILETPQGIIFPFGPSGRRNLIGGGIDGKELPVQALEREMDEELGIALPPHIIALGRLAGQVTSNEGAPFTADWHVFYAKTRAHLHELCIPGDDIRGFETIPLAHSMQHPLVTEMSKRALSVCKILQPLAAIN